MNQLHQNVQTVLAQISTSLTPSSYRACLYYLNRILKLADQNEITVPCQRLFDLAMKQATSSSAKRGLKRALKLIDREAGSMILLPDSTLLNPPELPAWSECNKLFLNRTFPVADNEIDAWPLILFSSETVIKCQVSELSQKNYLNVWRAYYSELLASGNTNFRRASVEDWIKKSRQLCKDGKICHDICRTRIRAAKILLEVAQTGDFKWKPFNKPVGDCGDEQLDALLAAYLSARRREELKEASLKTYSVAFRNFLKYSGIKSYDEFKNLTAERVQNTLTAMAGVLSTLSRNKSFLKLKSIFGYLYQQGILSQNFAGLIMPPVCQVNHLRTYIDSKDLPKLLEKFDEVSLRDKAIMLLFLRYGLRESDVVNLKFSEVDWKNDKIRLVQKKTSQPIELPLLEDVGNAIYDYIKNERPKAVDKSYPYIFLRREAPFIKLTSASRVCKKILEASGVKVVNGNSKGTHLFRHTLAYNLVKAKARPEQIKGALGHTSKESDKAYIAMDEAMLRQCPLDFLLIGQKYWDDEE